MNETEGPPLAFTGPGGVEHAVAQSSAHPVRVLMVDDNPGDVEATEAWLEIAEPGKFDIRGEETLADGIVALRTAAVDAVVLDLNLPDSRGIDTLRRLREARDDIAVVVYTGFQDSRLRSEVLREGALDCLWKNDSSSALLAGSLFYAVDRSQALRAHDQVRRLLASNPDAVIVVSTDGVVRFVNDAALEMFGRSREAFVGAPASFAIGADPFSEIDIDRDGERRSGEMRIAEVEWNREPAVLASIRDVTETKELAAQLRQSQKMEAIGRLAGGIAHDFNNMLTIIIGNLQLLARSLGDDGDARCRIDKAIAAARSGAELSHRLLSFTRQQVLETSTVDINEMVLDLEYLLRRTVGEHITISTKLCAGPALGRTDRHQLEHAIVNLCVNASDAMPDGGRLTIETRQTYLTEEYAATRVEVAAGPYIEIAVTDTGAGIPQKVMDRIFEPFFTTKERGKGTGLGLSMVFGFMKQSGGHVSVYSEVGHGTTFRLFVADTDTRREPERAPADHEVHATGGSGRATILVVEDDADVREVAVASLVDAGFDVVQANDGPAGLQAFIDHPGIAAVFTDVIMPGGMNGPEMVELIRKQRPDIPVLFASGYPEQALGETEASIVDASFVSKPYDGAELPARIEALLSPDKD